MTINAHHSLSMQFKKVVGFLLCISLTSLLLIYENHMRTNAIAGVYFHGIPSESMMQTISIRDLINEPLTSIWYLHIQPPIFDFLRMVLGNIFWDGDYLSTQYQVDTGLYILWAVIYGLMSLVMYSWLVKLTGIWFGVIGTIIFSASPAILLYSTTLETTLLSSFLIFWFFYLTWKIKNNESVSTLLLSVSFLLLFFTRSIFQWPWIIIIGVSLLLIGYPKKKLFKFILITSVVISLFLFKQYYLFGITSTSSFTGMNLCRSLAVCQQHVIDEKTIEHSNPKVSVLINKTKSNNSENFNNSVHLELNKLYINDYVFKLKHMSFQDFISMYKTNLLLYMEPSSNYFSSNQILNSIPIRWKSYSEKLMSAPVLPIVLIFFSMHYFLRTPSKSLIKDIGFSFPIFIIAVISIVFESGENMRFKFFIEPLIYLFISSQTYYLITFYFKKYQIAKPTSQH
ncbi:hypothetical protein [Polynucleobacter sp. AP-Latsch-80-C2]|jgi:hypothetical protein|uniref:hypothetical protein n=1 Tax=Polynucleobacter sp. AP-Latsch-80-C2 TaxID=2576931 RepID=UPI001C0D46C1|nr:hypothetical protein [Polynucleobacter sp. AP-Latsch-80-C2]MBU3623631.1 hypothetical protein [Polynucleobacter sp. AP-Latsch-80-C2]